MIRTSEVARLRQGLYRFFGAALLAPRVERIEALRASATYLESMNLEDYAFYRDWARLVVVIGETENADQLAPEYVRLFAAGTSTAYCPPIESYYRAQGNGSATAQVVADLEREYRRLGLAAIAATEPPDHAATELEVMSALCAREAAAWETDRANEADACLSLEAQFLSGHLGRWFPLVRRRIRDSDAGSFYRSLVDAIHAFVVHDGDLIRSLRRVPGEAL